MPPLLRLVTPAVCGVSAVAVFEVVGATPRAVCCTMRVRRQRFACQWSNASVEVMEVALKRCEIYSQHGTFKTAAHQQPGNQHGRRRHESVYQLVSLISKCIVLMTKTLPAARWPLFKHVAQVSCAPVVFLFVCVAHFGVGHLPPLSSSCFASSRCAFVPPEHGRNLCCALMVLLPAFVV